MPSKLEQVMVSRSGPGKDIHLPNETPEERQRRTELLANAERQRQFLSAEKERRNVPPEVPGSKIRRGFDTLMDLVNRSKKSAGQ